MTMNTVIIAIVSHKRWHFYCTSQSVECFILLFSFSKNTAKSVQLWSVLLHPSPGMFQQSEKSHIKAILSLCPAGQTDQTEESMKDIPVFIATPCLLITSSQSLHIHSRDFKQSRWWHSAIVKQRVINGSVGPSLRRGVHGPGCSWRFTLRRKVDWWKNASPERLPILFKVQRLGKLSWLRLILSVVILILFQYINCLIPNTVQGVLQQQKQYWKLFVTGSIPLITSFCLSTADIAWLALLTKHFCITRMK